MSEQTKSAEQLAPVAWQKFGSEYCLTGQFGMRPIFLSVGGVGKRGRGLRLLKDGLLVPLTPDHPHAKRLVDSWNACADMTDPAAEIAALRGKGGFIHGLLHGIKPDATLESIALERDAALCEIAALRAALASIEYLTSGNPSPLKRRINEIACNALKAGAK